MGVVTQANTVLDLTTLARVKALLKLGDSVAERDGKITNEIKRLSQAFVARTGRWTKQERRTEIVSFSSGRKTIFMRGRPIVTVHKLELSDSDDFTTSTTLVSPTDYHITAHLGAIHIRVDAPAVRRGLTRWPTFPSNARVESTSGFATTTDNLIADFPDIAGACEQQVQYWFQRSERQSLGSNSSLGANGETTYIGAFDDLPQWAAVIELYRKKL